MRKYTAILNIFMADRLLQAGFIPKEFKPSRKKRGKAAFIFEDTTELRRAIRELSKRK